MNVKVADPMPRVEKVGEIESISRPQRCLEGLAVFAFVPPNEGLGPALGRPGPSPPREPSPVRAAHNRRGTKAV